MEKYYLVTLKAHRLIAKSPPTGKHININWFMWKMRIKKYVVTPLLWVIIVLISLNVGIVLGELAYKVILKLNLIEILTKAFEFIIVV